jgi:hypothetical protein
LDAIEQKEREKDIHQMVKEQEDDRASKLQDAEDKIIDASEKGAGPKRKLSNSASAHQARCRRATSVLR